MSEQRIWHLPPSPGAAMTDTDRLLGYCPTSTTVTLVAALAGFIAGFLIVWRLLR